MKKLTAAIVFATTILFLTKTHFAYAGTSCTPIYGGGQTCVQNGNISINKTVQNPQNGVFVDNLGVNDPKFGPSQTVNFQISVTNTGGQVLGQVFVKDIFPQFLTTISGPGNFDANSSTLSFEVDNLNANETRTFNLSAQTVAANLMPSATNCVVNQSIATSNGQTNQDNAQFCIQQMAAPTPTPTGAPAMTKGGLKVFPPPQTASTPATGPEELPLLAMIPTGVFGYFLRKRASR